MEELCLMCKELMTNPLSIEVIGGQVETWIPEHYQEGFRRLHSVLLDHLKHHYRIRDSPEEQLICVHCYVKEIYQWLHSLDAEKAEAFLTAFSFGYPRDSFLKDGDFHPFEGEPKAPEFGICDECGEYSDTLHHVLGEWLCTDCAHFE